MVEQVNHPQHYNGRSDGIECIDIIRHYVYDIGAAIKYLWRAGLKSSVGKSDQEKEIEDLRKALWYVEDYKGVSPLLQASDCSDWVMQCCVKQTTGHSIYVITRPYCIHVSTAMRDLLHVGLIHGGSVHESFISREYLDDAISNIKGRIAELESKEVDGLNVRQYLDVPELDFSPQEILMQQSLKRLYEKEMAAIEDILRHHIKNPIEGEITREKIAAAGILGIVYDEEMDGLPFSEVKTEGQSVTFEVTSALLGVAQGEWLIGPGGIKRPLTKKELQKLNGESRVSGEEYIRELRKDFDYEKFKREYCGGFENENK